MGLTFCMRFRCPAKATRSIASGVAALVVIGSIGAACAYDERVIANCTDDYFAYCSQHAPESTEARYCMEAHRNELSKQCVKALVDAGEVPKKYLTKKVADRE